LNSPPESASLWQLQARFAAALRATDHGAPECVDFSGAVVADTLPALARLRVYRNNARAHFTAALQGTYPVVKRRVGDEFFAQLADEYRRVHPSQRGDLHWVGAAFPAWLVARLQGTDYAWLAELARLEWACEESLVAPGAPALALAELGRVPPESLERTGLDLHPSLRLVESAVPIWSVWRENQPEAAGRPVDLATGPERVLLSCASGGLELHRVPEVDFRFIAELASAAPLGAAVERSGLPVEQLARSLGWLFDEHLVAGLLAPPLETTR
jgi:hypothetical protein